MTWRSTLKSKACDVVPRFYKLGNQFAAEENLAVAQDLIKGSSFIRDGVDEEVSQPNNNMRANLVVTGIHEQLSGPRTVCRSYRVLLHWPFGSWPCLSRSLWTRGPQGCRLLSGNCGNVFIPTTLRK